MNRIDEMLLPNQRERARGEIEVKAADHGLLQGTRPLLWGKCKLPLRKRGAAS